MNSLVFREMWETDGCRVPVFAPPGAAEGDLRLPHLANNERDMGHPSVRGQIEFRALFPFPARAVFGILNHNSQRCQLVTNAVTPGEIARPASLVPLRNQGVDLLVAQRIRGQ